MRAPWIAGVVAGAVWLGASVATAKPAPPPKRTFDEYVTSYFSELALTSTTSVDKGLVRLGFLDSDPVVDVQYPPPAQGYDAHFDVKREVIGWSADKDAAWVTADLPETAGGMGGTTPSVVATAHGLAVFVPNRGGWHGVAFSIRTTLADKDQAAALKEGRSPPKLARKIDKGAEDAAKLFEATLGDPKALAASVSDRAEVVLQGSDTGDRAEGGKAVAALLAKWNLKLALRDGVQAGVAGKSLAWVAANVDAARGAKSVPYELLAVYEKTGSEWKLVAASFSFFNAH